MACESHHRACECREEEFSSLIREIMDSHMYKDSCDYQECELDPCMWCQRAMDLGIRSSIERETGK